jgi:uncharacterized protein (DUF58 family)
VRRASLAAGLGLVLCLTAATFGATPLYVPGVALVLVAALAPAWVWLARREASITRRIAVAAVEEQAGLQVIVRVVRSRVRLPGAQVRAWPEGATLELPRARDARVSAVVRFPRRGRHRLGPASLHVADPLGLCAGKIDSEADAVIVLPRIEPVRSVSVGGEAVVLGRIGPSAADAEATEVDSLRPHQPTTPASRIHWPTVARTATLMERRLVADADQRPLVVVDPRDPSSPAALDQAVRAAASLCVHLAREGGCAVLLSGDRRPVLLDRELHGWPELHARLALLDAEDTAPPAADLARAEVVLWVTAAPAGSSAMARLRARVRFLVSPHPINSWPVEFTVAGCSGQRLARTGSERRAA